MLPHAIIVTNLNLSGYRPFLGSYAVPSHIASNSVNRIPPNASINKKSVSSRIASWNYSRTLYQEHLYLSSNHFNKVVFP
ncbi:hypothetical protein [Geminiviridae sp.]|nr:hypothetical protein [Geminiviridae sp.]